RFNRDAGVPASRSRARRDRAAAPVEWEEEPFELVSPTASASCGATGGARSSRCRVMATLTERDGGTHLVYEVEARPRNVAGRLAASLQIGALSRRPLRAALPELRR